MKVNKKLQQMKFWVKRDKMLLQGDPGLVFASVSLKALWKALKEHGQEMVVEFEGLQTEHLPQEKTIQISWELEEVLRDFSQVFAEP